MGDILHNWIQVRLGIMIDLGPKLFGHYTRDGRLLAKILHSYDIINRDQLDMIVPTHDPAICRVNLKHLRFWLRFLGIDCDDESVEEISCSKGTTSLRLFYKVYLCLETKDRLHFITLQKEREKYVPTSRKFEVSTVCEDPPAYQPPEHPLSKKLLDGQGTVFEWHRSKFPAIFRKLKREREKLEVPAWEPYPIVRPIEHRVPEKSLPLDGRTEESEEADRFTRRTRARAKKLKEYEEKEMEAFEKELITVVEDPEMARTYVAWLKSRSKRAATVTALKANMQKTLVKELWDRIECRQEELVDKTIARRTLDQSRYEKQMVTKLCEVRNQMSIMTENQKILENMTATANEVEYRAIHERVKDVASRRQKDLEIECQRMCELRVRLREKKVQMLEEKHRNLCRETVLDILNLAMRIEDYRQMNDGIVPQTILREWTTKFVRGESLFDDDLPIGLTSGDSAEIDVSPILEESLRVKLEKAKVLRESLFDDYLESRPPWKQSSWLPAEDATETMELGRTVLGYVVHRLLNYIHPQSSDVETRALLPKPENIAIILGIMNPTMHESFRGLLDNTDVRLVRMEDAINYCLDRYKNESLDVEYIDASVIAATDEFVKSLESGKHRITCPAQRVSVSSKSDDGYSRRGRTSLLFRRSLVERTDGAKTSEKQTQTPRNIPHDDLDTMLTDSAFIGKCAYEFLALGQPITNDLATKILVEYLKTLDNTKGWAFIDYPNTYEQMSLLETALTGFKVPPDPEPLDFEHVTIEDIEPKSPRMVYEEEIDPSDHYRLSRLVPNPLKRIKDIVIPTFANLFVRVSQKPKNFELQDCSYERLSRNAPSVDKFYASREIGYFLYYTNLDRTTLKRLARLVVGEQLRGKSSEELFGDLPKSRERSKERNSVGSKAPVVRHMLSESSEDKDVSNEITEREEEAEIEMEEDEEEVGRGDYDLEQRRVRPGEENWEWIEFPLPSVLVEILSDLWQSMERCYVDDTKELLLLKSIHSSGIVPYKNFLTRNTAEFMKRPDNKQDLLHRFHLAFNAIDGDARHDEDIKCELHRRLADFQAELWEICDRRRHEAENERRRFIDEEWTVYETTVLFNVYVGLLQAELDRFVDTMHLLEDYYSAMLGKPLRDTRFAKVVLQRIQVGDVDPVFVHERSARFLQLDDAKSTTDRTETKRPKSKAGSVRTTVQVPHQAPSPPPPILDYILLRKEITDLLIDREARSRDLEEIRVFKAITENVRYARNIVDTLSATAIDFVEGENVAIPTDNDFTIDSNRGLDLALERRYAVAYEIDRIRQKLDSIAATAHTEFAFLLDTMRNSFHRIYDSILDRYWREMKSVNDMANVFCFAIEEGRCLENEMLLEGDRFVIRSNVFMMTIPPAKPPVIVKEIETASRFRIAQLSRLMETFRRVAPTGTMPERALVFILQDLASHGMDEGESMVLPCCWYQLRSTDISRLVRSLFESAAYVDWREFVIYAMDLPIPSYRDILIARDRFRIQDSDLKEVVTARQFIWTPLWFLEYTEIVENVFERLLDDFQRNREELYEEEFYHLDLNRYDSMPLEKTRRNSDCDSKTGCPLNEETLRLALGKELLCRMYSVGRRIVNYTALLLAFCKAEDPRDGFAKALALVIGSRVCTDLDEGERYVEELYEQRRRERQSRLSVEAVAEENFVAEGSPGTDSSSTEKMNRPIGISSSVSLLFGESDFKFRPADQESIVYWVSLDVCLTVLAAALPSYPSKPELYGASESLLDSLTAVFRDLQDPDLNDDGNVVLTHRLLNHEFMKQLLNSTSKFTVKNLGNTMQEVIRTRELVNVKHC